MAHTNKTALVAALMAVMFLGALDVTIVTIAAPRISGTLGGFSIISFLFSAYTLTSSVTVPIYGKLADLHGRKRILLIGIGIFLVGSLMCALSQDMLSLVISRAVQGSGTGAIFTLVNTIIGDVFELKTRSKVMGAVGTVWGVASLVGPFVGGLLIDNLSWHWIFIINIPISIAAMVLLGLSFKENFARRRARFDLGGATLLSLAILGVLLCFNAITTPSDTLGGGGTFAIAFAIVAAVALVAFIFVEKRAKEPIVPRHINTRATTVINIATFISSMALIGSTVYLPIYLQDVLGLSATGAGLVFLPQTIAWLLVSFTLARLLIRYGARRTLIAVSILMVAGYALYLMLASDTPIWIAATLIAFTGFGLGGVMNATLLEIQESVGIENRGADVGLNSMLKSVGQAIGVGMLGGVFNVAMLAKFNEQGIPAEYLNDPHSASCAIEGIGDTTIIGDFATATNAIFIVLLVLAVLTLLSTLLMPKDSKGHHEA